MIANNTYIEFDIRKVTHKDRYNITYDSFNPPEKIAIFRSRIHRLINTLS